MRLRQWLRFSLVLCLALPGFAAEHAAFTLPLLQGHPERWPEKITLTKELNLEDGSKVKKGKALRLVTFEGRITAVEVETGRAVSLSPGDCDFVEAANEEWASLNEEQRALSEETLTEPSLWPMEVFAARTLKTADGIKIPFGTNCDFLDYTPEGGARLYVPSENVVLRVPLRDTNFLFRARKLVLMPRNERPSRIIEALKGQLVNADGVAVPNNRLQKGQLFVLYFGASWSEASKNFTPQLVRFYKQVANDYPNLVVVFLSKDKGEASMRDYMRSAEMPWPAVPPVKVDSAPFLLAYASGAVPQLVVVDRFGAVLADSQANGKARDPKTILWDLGMMLDSGKGR